jgi:DNA-directed RNA polymerase specialized sigma24 family protein
MAETTTPSGERDDADAPRRDRPVEERAEEIVEQVSEQVVRFARRLVARAREEVEDIVAEADNLRRGEHSRR